MADTGLAGDEAALAMAAPLAAGRGLGRLIPPGVVLELCCGVGGLTRGLAQRHRVVAVDLRRDRLSMARENLAALGLEERAQWVCCDLRRPSLLSPPPHPYAACVLDPDWSPEGAPPWAWTRDPQAMRPPASGLVAWARGQSHRLALRLPPGWDCADWAGDGAPCRRLEVARGGRTSFVFILVGDWPPGPERLEA